MANSPREVWGFGLLAALKHQPSPKLRYWPNQISSSQNAGAVLWTVDGQNPFAAPKKPWNDTIPQHKYQPTMVSTMVSLRGATSAFATIHSLPCGHLRIDSSMRPGSLRSISGFGSPARRSRGWRTRSRLGPRPLTRTSRSHRRWTEQSVRSNGLGEMAVGQKSVPQMEPQETCLWPLGNYEGNPFPKAALFESDSKS